MKHSTNKPSIPLTPVPLRARHDGWTPDRQILFIEALAESGCVEEACRRAGMSDSAAYKLRNRPSGRAFRLAWDAALDCALQRIEHAAFGRSLNGVARPVFHKGEQVGEWRHFDERLTMFLLRARRSGRYGRWIDGMIGPDDEDEAHDAAIRLDGGISRIEWQGDDEDNEGGEEAR
jgi:hypothetical protein